jgi:DNA-binding ferritin-like protein
MLEFTADCLVVPFATPAQVRDALRDQVATFLHSLRNVVKQFVELHEPWPLDVPMGMLRQISRSLDKDLWFLESHVQKRE